MPTYVRPVVALVLLGAACLAADSKAPVKMTDVEKEVLRLTNAARAKAGLQPLRPNTTLFKVAQAHAENMAKQRKPEHVLDGKTPFQRIKAAGYRYYVAGENVAYGDDVVAPATIFDAWMKSKGHRDNILKPEYTEIGLGHAENKEDEIYYAQVFATPSKRK